MAINWNGLNEVTGIVTGISTSGQDKVEFVTCVGLRVSLSEIQSRLPPAAIGEGVSIYVDTLVVDQPAFDFRGVSVIARVIDISLFTTPKGTEPMVLRPETINCFVVAGECSGGRLSFNTLIKPDAVAFVPTGVDPLCPFLIEIGEGAAQGTSVSPAATLPTSLGRPAALNALRASYMAATVLMETSQDEARATARAMLEWVTSCCASVEVSDDGFTELRTQAAALLLTLGIGDGVYYAPALSADYYKVRIGGLIEALEGYESQLHALDVQANTETAIVQVSSVLEKNAEAVSSAYAEQIAGIEANVTALLGGIQTLQVQYREQAIECEKVLKELGNALGEQRLKDYLSAAIGVATGTVKSIVSANPLDPKPGDAVQAAYGAVTSAIQAISILMDEVPDSDKELLEAAKTLVEQQDTIVVAMLKSYQLWRAAPSNPQVDLRARGAVLGVDPRIAWRNFLTNAEAKLNRDFGAGPQKGLAISCSASLSVLVEFGIGICSNLVALTEQLAQGVTVLARHRASRTISNEWKMLAANCVDTEERLRALRGLVSSLATTVKRSIFTSYRYYRNAYFYRILRSPPEQVSMEMDSAQLRKAFNDISTWTSRASDLKVILPNDTVKVSLRFPIGTTAVEAGRESAAVTRAGMGKTTSIRFGFSWGSAQLKEVLTNGGAVAMWVTKAEAFIEGVVPNSKNNVIFRLSTSGAYQNGFDGSQLYTFVNAGVSGNFAYKVDRGETSVYNPWKIPTLVYATPTPYTQWLIEMDADGGDAGSATAIRLELEVSYADKRI